MNLHEKHTFTIGQFAALHDINKKTLMWYDEIGLLKPAFIRDNGYRCYTYQQSNLLEVILLLRELDVPIADIKRFMAERSAEKLDVLLAEQLEKIDARMAWLSEVRQVVQDWQGAMQTLGALNLEKIEVIETTEPQYHLLVETSSELSMNEEIARIVSALKTHQVQRRYIVTYGALLPVEALYAERFDDYTALTITLTQPLYQEGLHEQPPGRYLRAYHRGDWERLPECYRAMLAFANHKGLQLQGFVYGKGMNGEVALSMEDYITQIDIPLAD